MMEPTSNTARLRRRATVFRLSRHLSEVGLRINPDAMLRELEDMEGVASGHTRPEVWQILGELQRSLPMPVSVDEDHAMSFAAHWVALRLAAQVGFKLWSPEARTLARMILSSARESPEASRTKLTKQLVFEGASRLAGSKKARALIAQDLGVTPLDAWMVQERLNRAVERLQGGAAVGAD